ncbi:hypothetical protein SAMN05216428_10293 [Nitrosospira sp. Nsp11]|nr:hypothetical protein SAMN05216428_10293 [Nitrosospira sp. Nsp11]
MVPVEGEVRRQFILILVITDFSNNEKEHNDDEFLEARQEKHWPWA